MACFEDNRETSVLIVEDDDDDNDDCCRDVEYDCDAESTARDSCSDNVVVVKLIFMVIGNTAPSFQTSLQCCV